MKSIEILNNNIKTLQLEIQTKDKVNLQRVYVIISFRLINLFF